MHASLGRSHHPVVGGIKNPPSSDGDTQNMSERANERAISRSRSSGGEDETVRYVHVRGSLLCLLNLIKETPIS